MRLVILCIEDEPDVRSAVVRDLEPFEPVFLVEAAESVEDARSVVAETSARGDRVALVVADHLLPGVTGTDFLVELQEVAETQSVRKILLTGQAGHDDTIKAVNRAGLDYYVTKPWEPHELRGVVREQLTDFVIDEMDDLLAFMEVLDPERLLEAVSRRGFDR